MADTLPINFPVPGESASANYDYYDIAEGTGIKLFYGMTTSAQTAIAAHTTQSVKYILSTETIGSDGETKDKSGATAADAEAFDLDFDLAPFNLPKKIKGTAYVTLNGSMTSNDPAINHSACFKINVCKWNPTTSTETVIGTGYSNPGGTVTNGTNTFFLSIPILITSVYGFGIGEQLRLNIIAYTRSSNAGQGGTVKLEIDPLTAAKEIKFWCPFRITQ